MHARWQVALLISAAFIAFISPIGLAQYVAWLNARSQALKTLETYTANLLQRSEKTRTQVVSVLSSLNQQQNIDPCLPEQRQFMRHLVLAAPYVQGAGFIQDGAITCSTFSDKPMSFSAQEPELLSEHGVYFWNDASLDPYQALRFNLYSLATQGYAVIVSPELAMDVLPQNPSISLIHVGAHSGQILRAHGFYQPQWFAAINPQQTTFLTSTHLVHSALAENAHTIAIAAMSRTQLDDYFIKEKWYTTPWGLLVGTLLALLIYLYAKDRFSLKGRLQTALKNNELTLMYQPVIDLKTGQCLGAEALLRWRSAQGEMVNPEDFIRTAEERGLMRTLTQYVLRHVARETKALFALAPNAHIAINFSAQDFHSPWLQGALNELIEHAQASPHNIVVEATERGFMDPTQAQPIIKALRAQGFKVAIDDFGTGSSSLSYLASYELDYLKLDKLFVAALGQNTAANRIAMKIIEMSHTLKLEIIAEGVETTLQHHVLTQAGVQCAQGFLYAKPIGMAELLTLISANPVATLFMPTATGR